MENESQPTKHKRGSSPQESVQDIYHSWLNRSGKKLVSPGDKESQAKVGADAASKAKQA